MASLACGDGKHCERVESGLGTALSPSHATHSQPESHLGFFECIQLHARTESLKESLVLSCEVSNASKQAAEQTGEQEKAKAGAGGEERSHMYESLLGLWRLLSLKEIQPW